jgi:hypothetical protein
MIEWHSKAIQLKKDNPDMPYRKIAEIIGGVSDGAVKKVILRDRWGGTEKGKVTYEDKKTFDESDIDKYIDTMKAMQKAADALDTKQVKAHVTIDDDKPIGIALWADWHIGAKGVDYERFEIDKDKIINTDGLHWVGLGDYKDNYQSYGHPGAQYEQIIQPGMQDLAVKRIMEQTAYNCLALVRGCHDDWDKKSGDKDFIEAMCEAIGAERGIGAKDGPINLWHGGDLHIRAGLIDYHFKLRHKYKFESSLNLENSMRRIMEIQGPCDVACSAHLHNPYYMDRHLMGEYRIMARSGSYKMWDEFAQKLAGYKGKAGVPVIILFPHKKQMIPLMLDEAIDVLSVLRK